MQMIHPSKTDRPRMNWAVGAGGIVPGAAGGALNSPVAIGIGTGVGVAAWAVIQSDDPVSHAK